MMFQKLHLLCVSLERDGAASTLSFHEEVYDIRASEPSPMGDNDTLHRVDYSEKSEHPRPGLSGIYESALMEVSDDSFNYTDESTHLSILCYAGRRGCAKRMLTVKLAAMSKEFMSHGADLACALASDG